MQIKFPPLIDVGAELVGAKVFGHETFVIELNVGKKVATITLSKTEASNLIAALKDAGVMPPVNLSGIVLPKGPR